MPMIEPSWIEIGILASSGAIGSLLVWGYQKWLFHEKASLVKVDVATEAETKAAKRTPLATLPFALSLSLLFGGSVHDGFRPGLRRCNLKCGLCLDQSHLAQSP